MNIIARIAEDDKHNSCNTIIVSRVTMCGDFELLQRRNGWSEVVYMTEAQIEELYNAVKGCKNDETT